jgi:hypothetical protein
MFSMPDIEFARTLCITAKHLVHASSVFIWTGSNFAIEVNRDAFIAEICQEFGLIRDIKAEIPVVCKKTKSPAPHFGGQGFHF